MPRGSKESPASLLKMMSQENITQRRRVPRPNPRYGGARGRGLEDPPPSQGELPTAGGRGRGRGGAPRGRPGAARGRGGAASGTYSSPLFFMNYVYIFYVFMLNWLLFINAGAGLD